MTAPKATTASKTAKSVDEIEAYFEGKKLRQAPAWMPESGSTIKGEVIGLKMGDGDYGQYPIIVYKVLYSTNDAAVVGETVSVHAFHTIMRQSLAELKTDIGSVQWITYEGERETNDSKRKRKLDPKSEATMYHLYDIINDGDNITGKDENFAF